MQSSTTLSATVAAATFAIVMAGVAVAEPIAVKPLHSGATEDLGGKFLTVLEATLEPGAGMPPHKHPGTVYAYVSSGSIESKLSTDDAVITYTAGQGWVEAPGVIHEVFQNPSESEMAVVTATFIHREGEELVIPVE